MVTKKSKSRKKKKMGRPRIEIDMNQLEVFCQVLCTKDEIGLFFGLSSSTLDRRIKEETGKTFEEFYKKHSMVGKTSLRRAQFKNAMSGNTSMQIWLGKQLLKQTDRPIDDDSAGEARPLKIIIQVEDASKNQSE